MIAALAWLALSNHCLLGAIQSNSTMQSSCHGSAAGNGPPRQKEDDIECCKILRATVPTLGTSVVLLEHLQMAFLKDLVGVIVLPETHGDRLTFEGDTGPPVAFSFCESVLQRSILAHAPPLL